MSGWTEEDIKYGQRMAYGVIFTALAAMGTTVYMLKSSGEANADMGNALRTHQNGVTTILYTEDEVIRRSRGKLEIYNFATDEISVQDVQSKLAIAVGVDNNKKTYRISDYTSLENAATYKADGCNIAQYFNETYGTEPNWVDPRNYSKFKNNTTGFLNNHCNL